MNAGGRKSGSTITSTPSTTTYTYDQFGNFLTEKNAANATESYTYDLNGAMLTKTDRKGVQSLYSYDNRGRMLSETIGSGAAQLVHSYTYGLNGSLLSESQSGNTITYKYDELGRLTEEYTAPFYKNYTYNIADLRTSFILDFPGMEDGPRIYENYYYDATGRLTRVADYMSYLDVSYTYDANNNITGTSYYAGPDQTYAYNSANQIVTVTTPTSTTPLTQHSYTYDLAGRQISVTDTTTGTTTAYTYDTKGQLTAENRTGGTSAQNYSKAYTYDPRGNRITLANSGTSTSYIYNAVNHLQNSTTSGTATTYTYDANGNTLTDQTGIDSALTYTYDVENRLIAINGDNLNVTYAYYPNGLRMSKTVNGNTTLYFWDGDQLVFELGDGETKYLRGLSLFAKVSTGYNTKEFYLYDGHGNVTGLGAYFGDSFRSYEYDAFGNQLNIDPADTNPFRYCGEYYDAETGSYYLRARYYDSSIGRFTQEDPHWNTGNMVYGDDPAAMSRGLLDLEAEYYLPSVMATRQSGNLYVYTTNSPLCYTDPSGEVAFFAFLATKPGQVLVSAAVGGISTGIAYHSDGKSFWAGLINGGMSGAVSGMLGVWRPDALTAFVGAVIGSLTGAYVENSILKNNDDLPVNYQDALVSGVISGISASYWNLALVEARLDGSAAKKWMQYSDEFGAAINHFFSGIMSGFTGKEK